MSNPNASLVRGCAECPLLEWGGVDHAMPGCSVSEAVLVPQTTDDSERGWRVSLAVPATCPLWCGPWTVTLFMPSRKGRLPEGKLPGNRPPPEGEFQTKQGAVLAEWFRRVHDPSPVQTDPWRDVKFDPADVEVVEVDDAIKLRAWRPREGEMCGHPGCLQHRTEPCEGCGRIMGYPSTGTSCPITSCGLPQFRSPGGTTCGNGHGGVDR